MQLSDEALQEVENTLSPGADNGLTASLDIASKRNPDQYAEVLSLSERSGLPSSTVESEYDEVKRNEGLRDLGKDKLGETNPVTAEYYRDPDNASVSYDDLDILRGLEDVDRKVGRAQTALGKLYRGFAGGFTSTAKAHSVEMGEAHSVSLDMMKRIDAGEDLSWYEIKNPTVRAFEAADPDERAEMLRATERKLDPRQYSSWKNAEAIDRAVEEQIEINPEYAEEFIAGKIPEGFGSMFSFMTVAMATRGAGVKGIPSAFPTGQFAAEQMRGTSFEEALNKGATFEESFQAANMNSIMGYSEALPISRMFDRFDSAGGGQIRKQLTDTIKAGTEEAIQEFSQQLWSNMVASDIVGYDPDQKLLTGTGEGAGVGFTVGALTQFVGGLVAGRRSGGAAVVNREMSRDIEDASRTLQEQEAIDEIVSLSQSSTTRGRAQDRFKGFLSALQTKEVLIPADVVESLENAPESMTTQLDGTGSDISIPLDVFTNDIATDESLMGVIRPHIKLTHEAKTLSELENDPEGVVQRLVKRAIDKDEAQTESDRIYQEVKDQIVATGRQSEETARLSAAIYPAMVDRISEEYNLTPAEVYQRLGLRGIVGPGGDIGSPDETMSAAMEQSVDELPDRAGVIRYIRGFEGQTKTQLMNIVRGNIDRHPDLHHVDSVDRPPVVTDDVLSQIPNPMVIQSSTPDKMAAIWDVEGNLYRVIRGDVKLVDKEVDPNSDLSKNEGMTLNILSKVFRDIKNSDPAEQQRAEQQRAESKETSRRQQHVKDVPMLSPDFDTALQELADYAENLEEFKTLLNPDMFDIGDRNRTRLGRATMALEPDEYENAGSGEVTIYRALPEGEDIEAGDWVSFDRQYASGHETNVGEEGGDTVAMEVEGSDVWWFGADQNEWVYIPPNTWSVDSIEELWGELSPDKPLKYPDSPDLLAQSGTGVLGSRYETGKPAVRDGSPILSEAVNISGTKVRDDKNLFVSHNLSAENILAADKLGGLAAPSIAVGKVGPGFSDFGEVSLIADPSLLDDPKAHTFDADIYSPRQPRSTYDVDTKSFREFVANLDPDNIGLNLPDIQSLEGDGAQAMIRSDAVKLQWLESQGKAPKLKNAKVDPITRKASKLDTLDVRDEKFQELARQHFQKKIDAIKSKFPERAERFEDMYFLENGKVKPQSLYDFENVVRNFKISGGKDKGQFRKDITGKFRTQKINNEYEQWVTDQFNDMVKGEKLFKGFTPSGNRKYVPYNMNNIVKEMTQQLQAGEGSFYGAGTVRSAYANELKNLAQIRAKRDQIISEEDFAQIKEDSQQVFTDAMEDLKPFYKFDSDSWGYMDDAGTAIVEGRKGQREAFDMTPEAQKIIDDLTEYLQSLPTLYFESKIQRPVEFSEFNTAVVPRGMRKDAVKVLKDAGLKIKTYDPTGKGKTRDDVIAEQSKLLFQNKGKQTTRGQLALFKDNTRLMRLTEASDLSTFLHESAHLFLELEKQLATEFGTTDNQKVLLEFLDVESFNDIETEHHEKFAETFEVYLREGKAPSLRLRDAFAAFGRWLKRIYQTLTDPRLKRADLSPEITEVMDRMLATESEIEEAMANPAYDEFFRSKEAAGMTDEEWEKYQKAQVKRKQKAEEDLGSQVISELTKRKTAEWNEEKQPLVEEETERLNKEPVYQLRGDLTNYPMDYEILKDEVGFDKLPGKLIGKARKEEGVDPAEYAEAYGYKSVQEMYDDLVEAPSIKAAAEAAAEARMVEKYGDILNDGSIEQEAREAVHNDAQAELLLMELKALGRKTGKVEINRDYLKAEAKRMISTMTYGEIKPTKFYNAEIRAAKKTVTAKDDNAAYQSKVQQIVNHYLYREAIDTKRRMERQRKYVRSVQTRSFKSKDVGAEYIQNMKTLANLYDLRSNTDQAQAVQNILEWYETQIADENQLVQITLLDEFLVRGLEAKRTGKLGELKFPQFDDLTVDQMRGLYEMLRHLRFVGGKMSDGDKARRAAERENLSASIIANGGDNMPGTRGVPSDASNRRRKWSHMVNKLPSMRNMMRKLDGFKDSGEAYRQIYALLENGGSEKVRMRRETYERFESEMGDIHKVGLSRKDNAIKTYRLESGLQLNIHSEARFMMSLYWGNESAREAIRQGFGVTDRDVITILSDMTQEQLELANTTWKVNESMWPELSAASVRQYGVAPPKLDPTPFTVNGVELTGGHMRLFYDSTTIELSNDRENSGSYASIMPTKAGSLHSRVGSGGKPPLLDKNNITRAMEDTIHFVAFADVGAELRGIVNTDEIRGAIEQKHGQGFYQAMIESIDSISGNRSEREAIPQLASMFRLLRRAATAKHLMYSIRNTVQQFGAIPVATDEVGTVSWFGALARYSSDNKNFTSFVNDRSEFMRDRAALVNREAAEYLRNVTADSQTEHLWSQFARFGFTPQTIVDATVAYPVWMARYEQSMEQQGDEKRAVSDADTSVAESVGSGSDLHLGQVFHSTNSEWVRTFTMFGSWFNAYYQRIYRDVGRAQSDPSMKTTYEAMRTLITTPFIVGVASAMLVMDGPEDDSDEAWLTWMGSSYAKFMAGTVPLLRDVASFSFDGFSPKTVWSGGAEAPMRFANELKAYHDGKQSGLKTVTDVAKVVTTVLPVPGSGNVIRVADYIDSANQGKETDKGWFLNSYQSITEGADK